MHKTALEHAGLFFDTYLQGKTGLKIVEIGSQDVNGSIRSQCPAGNDYLGVDFVKGKGVDYILNDPYVLPFDDNDFDVCVTSSCFEHSEFFWLLFMEISRIVKPGGIIYINVPSNGMVHQWPVDCWRFYPDSGIALQNWAKRSGQDITLLESFIGSQRKSLWNDFVGVFVKGERGAALWPDRITDRKDILEGYSFTFTNARILGQDRLVRFDDTTEDQRFKPIKAFRRWFGVRRGKLTFRE